MTTFFQTALGQVVLVGAAIGALGLIWRKAIKPVVDGAAKAKDLVDGMNVLLPMVPLLVEVVDQVRRNGGSSMHDKIEATHDGVTAAVALAEEAKIAAEEAKDEAVRVKTKVANVARTQKAHRAYVHEKFHGIENSLTVIQGMAVLDEKRHQRRASASRPKPRARRK